MSKASVDGNAPFQGIQGTEKNIPTSYAGSIFKPHNSCNSIQPMCGTKQVGIWSEKSVLMPTTPPPGLTHTLGGVLIDHRLCVVATRTPAVSREDSRPQAILKFYRLSRLDYRARND